VHWDIETQTMKGLKKLIWTLTFGLILLAQSFMVTPVAWRIIIPDRVGNFTTTATTIPGESQSITAQQMGATGNLNPASDQIILSKNRL